MGVTTINNDDRATIIRGRFLVNRHATATFESFLQYLTHRTFRDALPPPPRRNPIVRLDFGIRISTFASFRVLHPSTARITQAWSVKLSCISFTGTRTIIIQVSTNNTYTWFEIRLTGNVLRGADRNLAVCIGYGHWA